MESASSNAPNLGSNFALPRVATEEDEAEIFRMLDNAPYSHFHADWSISADFWLQSGSALCERNGSPIGFIAATLEPPPIAWIRSLAISLNEPNYPLRTLLSFITPKLRIVGAKSLAILSANRWVNEAMPLQGFETSVAIEEMIKEDLALPALPDSRVRIRSVDSADFALLAQLDQRAFSNPIWWHSERHLRRAYSDAISYSIAELDGKAVGYQLSIRSGSRQAHLVRLVIDQAYQGQGIASTLLASAIADFSQLGITKISLNTQTDNQASHRLYRRFGFEPTGISYPVWTKPI